MFSVQDVRDILQSLPPDENTDLEASGLPMLLISSQGQGFVTTAHARREFERILNNADSRLLATDIAQDIGIETDAVLRFAASSPALALLGQDQTIIPRSQIASLKQTLRTLLAQELVSKANFARENNVSPESLESLLQQMQGENELEGGLACLQGYLASQTYRLVLSKAIRARLDETVKEARPTELRSEMLPGMPPKWYTSQILNMVLEEYPAASKFHVSEALEVIRCTPEESVLQQRDTAISQLQTGTIPYLDLEDLFNKFSEIYPSMKHLEDHLADFPEVYLHGRTAVSNPWLSTFGDACLDALNVLGYAELTSRIKDTFPSDCHTVLFKKLEENILGAFPEDDKNKLHKVGGYLLASYRYKRDCELLLHSATAHATHHWKGLKGDPQKELKFQIVDIFNFIPEDQAILRALSDDPGIRKTVEEAYWTEISRLEGENEAEFSKFWAERVVSRVSNYTQGLKALPDLKLADQLSQLLSSYLTKELIPESITKAKSRDLLRSRKTKKNAQKLEAAVQKVSIGDLAGTLAAMDKFHQKQGVEDFDVATLAATKQILVNDLVRRMQKQSDGPTLFLLLVIVLLAKYSEGVVYSTGKYAPKLMKLLKPSLTDEEYKQLEGWKNKAKASALVAEDMDEIKRMAQNALKSELPGRETVASEAASHSR